MGQGIPHCLIVGLEHDLFTLVNVVSLATGATLGVYMCKSRVYDAVQADAERVPGLKCEPVFKDPEAPALGGET